MPAIDGAPRVAPRDHPLERAARGRSVPGPRTGALVPSAGPLAMTGGEPLPGADRRYFEQRLGHDFSAVRLHADERGAALASGLDALAFTSGTHIGFGEGRYRPSTSAGRALIGHELMHVAQVQAAGAGSGAAAMLWLARRATLIRLADRRSWRSRSAPSGHRPRRPDDSPSVPKVPRWMPRVSRSSMATSLRFGSDARWAILIRRLCSAIRSRSKPCRPRWSASKAAHSIGRNCGQCSPMPRCH
ncbi:MAG: DUF4157 domain-containing protein [Ideonella sp.]|nr:DUF4157 domain-containing protein [Ideonella sp.]